MLGLVNLVGCVANGDSRVELRLDKVVLESVSLYFSFCDIHSIFVSKPNLVFFKHEN